MTAGFSVVALSCICEVQQEQGGTSGSNARLMSARACPAAWRARASAPVSAAAARSSPWSMPTTRRQVGRARSLPSTYRRWLVAVTVSQK
jgi:hypothetical protein